jgi:hypothetical protein
MRARFLVLATLTSLAPITAHADAAKAWSAAKANLPSDATIVAGFNFGAIAKSQIFTEMFPKLVASNADLKDFLDLAKSACGIDPITAIAGAVVATDTARTSAVVYLALNNLDQSKLASCADKLAKAKSKGGDEKITFKKDGNIVEVTSTKQSKSVFYGWVGSDVIVIPKDGDKASLQRWMGGKAAFTGSTLGKLAGKVNTGAAGWGATTESKAVQPGMDMKGGYGSLDLAKGNITVNAHVVLATPAMAAQASTEANKQLAQIKTSGQLPAMFTSLLASLKVTSDASELVVGANAPEKDVLAVAQMLMAMSGMGGGSSAQTPPPPPPPPPHTTSPGLGGAKP